MPLNLKMTSRKTATSNFQKGNRFLLWPDRTRVELERLCIKTEGVAPIPPRWRRIAPAQYLKERPRNICILDASGRKPTLIIQLMPARQQSIDVTRNNMP